MAVDHFLPSKPKTNKSVGKHFTFLTMLFLIRELDVPRLKANSIYVSRNLAVGLCLKIKTELKRRNFGKTMKYSYVKFCHVRITYESHYRDVWYIPSKAINR